MAQQLNAAVFFILAVAGLEVFGVILGGYASGSKWSLYGAMREAAQVVSYEIPLALCVVVPVMVAGTMDLVEIGKQQAGWFTNWLIFHDPFTFVTFWVYVTCAVASVNRAPFDLAEAESELVAGFMTEYSGFRWCIFFMAEYASMFVVSGLAAILFLGGWNGPVPIAHWLGLVADPSTGYSPHPLLAYLGNLLGMCNFIQGRGRRDVHDVAPLDAAAAADRPGDDHLPEVLHPAGLRRAVGGDVVDLCLGRMSMGINWHSFFFLLAHCSPAASPWRW